MPPFADVSGSSRRSGGRMPVQAGPMPERFPSIGPAALTAESTFVLPRTGAAMRFGLSQECHTVLASRRGCPVERALQP